MSKPRRKALRVRGGQEDLTTAAEAADGLRRDSSGVLRSADSGRPVMGAMRQAVQRVNGVMDLTTAQQAAIDAGLVSEQTVQVKPRVAREMGLPKGWNMTATHFRVPEGSQLLKAHGFTELTPGHLVVAIVLHDDIKVAVLPEDAIVD